MLKQVMQYRCSDVYAVIVTFNPDLRALDALADRLLPQVGGAVVVDNGSSVDVAEWFARSSREHLELKLLPRNQGIASAQNVGIAEARRRGAAFVLLSDQDSQPANDMVYLLRKAACDRKSMGCQVAAVGPRFLDARQNNPPPFIEIRGFRVHRRSCEDKEAVVTVDYLIASGCLIPMGALERVGGMREDMFIDYVDIEWGLRAKGLGYQSYGVCGASMNHELGDAPISFFGKRYTLHSPLRHYYRFRNATWMYKQAHIPLQWKVADGVRLVWKYAFYSLFASPRLAHFRMMTLGVIHGLWSRLGPFE